MTDKLIFWQSEEDLRNEIWTTVNPIKEMSSVYLIYVEDGLKLKMKKIELERLQSNLEFLNQYQLNIKRLNRWWYSVYFKKKENINND